MSDRTATRDPYTESGHYASARRRRRVARNTLLRSIEGADGLHAWGHHVIARGGKAMVASFVLTSLTLLGAFAIGFIAFGSYDGSYDGAVRANWMLLLSVASFVGAQYLWLWFVKSRERLRTGRRLLMRSEYQRRQALLKLAEAERKNHEALR